MSERYNLIQESLKTITADVAARYGTSLITGEVTRDDVAGFIMLRGFAIAGSSSPVNGIVTFADIDLIMEEAAAAVEARQG